MSVKFEVRESVSLNATVVPDPTRTHNLWLLYLNNFFQIFQGVLQYPKHPNFPRLCMCAHVFDLAA